MTVRAEAQIDLARVDDGAAGQNGATFTPSVDAAGDISWTNDGGLPNPQTQNIMGPQGDPGTPGTNGVSVTAVEPQYYLSTSDSSATGGSWSSTPATFVSGCYYWTRDYITFSDGTHDTSTEVYNAGMTQAAQDAYDALTLADDTNQYFWYAPTGADTGAHITEVPQDEWNDISDPNYHSGGNLLARSNGIAVRDGMTELATFGASGAQIGQNGADKIVLDPGSFYIQTITGERAISVDAYGQQATQTVYKYISDTGQNDVIDPSDTVEYTIDVSELQNGDTFYVYIASAAQGQTGISSLGYWHIDGADVNFTISSSTQTQTISLDFAVSFTSQWPLVWQTISESVSLVYDPIQSTVTITAPNYIKTSADIADAKLQFVEYHYEGDVITPLTEISGSIYLSLETSGSSGTDDDDLYNNLTYIGWDSEVIV